MNRNLGENLEGGGSASEAGERVRLFQILHLDLNNLPPEFTGSEELGRGCRIIKATEAESARVREVRGGVEVVYDRSVALHRIPGSFVFISADRAEEKEFKKRNDAITRAAKSLHAGKPPLGFVSELASKPEEPPSPQEENRKERIGFRRKDKSTNKADDLLNQLAEEHGLDLDALAKEGDSNPNPQHPHLPGILPEL